jgi:hypothetical protein
VTDGLVARDSVQVRHVANSTEAVSRKFHWRPVSAQAGVCQREHRAPGRRLGSASHLTGLFSALGGSRIPNLLIRR